MTLRHLQIFRTVCRLESVSQAADKLDMTQPAVSIAMKELETFYGVKLFERMNRRMYITEAGQILLQYAETVLSQIDESVDVLRESGREGRCRFGVNVTAGETILLKAAERIRRDMPGMRLNVYVENSSIIEKMLTANEIDFAVVDGVTFGENWKTEPMYTEKMCAVCRPDLIPEKRVLTVKDLSEQKLLLREKGSGSRNCVEAVFERHNCVPCPVVESISTLSLISLAECGMGFSILPCRLVTESISSGRLTAVPVIDDVFERKYYLMYHMQKYLTATMKSVIDILKEIC